MVAETFLQRTRAAQAEFALAEFAGRYPDASDFASASDDEVREVTNNLGLHWRGPLLRECAREVSRLGGVPPKSLPELRALPGVGPYASAAWLSLHAGSRAVIVDNNVARWLCRMTGETYTPETRRKRWVAELADQLTPQRAFRAYNYAVLDFTMLVCQPRSPKCSSCPIRRHCVTGLLSEVGTL